MVNILYTQHCLENTCFVVQVLNSGVSCGRREKTADLLNNADHLAKHL